MINNTTSLLENITLSGNGNIGQPFMLPDWGKIILCIGYGCTLVVGLIGNGVVLVTTQFKTKRKRKSSDQLIISLAMADLLGSISIPTYHIHNIITNAISWKLLGNFGCKFFQTTNVFATVASTWMVVAIAVGRLRIIRRSTQIQGKTDVYSIISILQAWLVAALIAAPHAYYLDVRNGYCNAWWESPDGEFIWIIMFCFVWLIIPFIILVVVYPISYKYLQQKTFNPSSSTSTTTTSASIQHSKRNKTIARMFSIIIIVFLVCVTPCAVFSFTWYYIAYYNYEYVRGNYLTFYTLNYILSLVGMLSPAINPFIYAQARLTNYRKKQKKRTLSKNTTSKMESSFSGIDNTAYCNK